MSLYAIGDIQGCREALERLLEAVRFDPTVDRVVLVGDLVNRGPDSLGTVRLVRSLGASALSILGNHDLNALAVAHGVREPRPRDTLDELLGATDATELLDWLRGLPLLVEQEGIAFAHAGIYPLWTLEQARRNAREVEAVLAGTDYRQFLTRMYGAEPTRWHDGLSGWKRLRFITNSFTRMRFVDSGGALDFSEAGPPGSQRRNLYPWFELPARRPVDATVVFGHWSALGRLHRDDVIGLDTGCVWGRQLTAVKLDGDPFTFHTVACNDRTQQTGAA